MKVLFVVQGEGRGHMTQAITMQRMLERNGHQVVEVLVGKSNVRQLPEFFVKGIHAPIQQFFAPNFLPTPANKRINLPRSIAYNLLEIPTFLRSIFFLHRRINRSGADLVINFYDMLTGFTYLFFRPVVPQVAIGHQYLFLHHDFKMPKKNPISLFLLKLMTHITALGAQRRLALSFYPKADDKAHDIKVVPPLLREEVHDVPVSSGSYIHGYMLNAGFGRSVMEWHKKRPDVPMYFFWDKKGAALETKVDDTLTFHQLDDKLFLRSLAGSCGYATTAGFESVCEAMYFGKPILMIPAHIEQDCNAYDACNAGAGVAGRDFNLNLLLPLIHSYHPVEGFREWVDSSEQVILPQLEMVANTVPHYPFSLAWFRTMWA